MKTIAYLSLGIMLSLMSTRTYAHQLDGLWRNVSENITLRIESTSDGFKAKRQDQGIWYFYQYKEDQFYADKSGNYYEVLEDDLIVWRDAATYKKLLFKRVGYREETDWNSPVSDRYDPDGDRWNDHDQIRGNWNDHVPSHINGSWISQGHRKELIIEAFRDGLRVRRPDGRWVQFLETRENGVYRNAQGDLIILHNSNTLQWKSRDRDYTTVYHKFGSRSYHEAHFQY